MLFCLLVKLNLSHMLTGLWQCVSDHLKSDHSSSTCFPVSCFVNTVYILRIPMIFCLVPKKILVSRLTFISDIKKFSEVNQITVISALVML